LAPNPIETLQKHQFILLTTFRKSGEAVPTPVWFASLDGKLYVWTQSTTGKAKRLRKGGRVQFAPSTFSGKLLGEPYDGIARILPQSEEAAPARAFIRKYGIQKRLFDWLWRKTVNIYIEIVPAEQPT
jgi:hypothetical protein